MLIGKNGLCEMSYTNTEVCNRLSLVPLKPYLCSVSSIALLVGGLEHEDDFAEGFEVSQKNTKNGNRTY